MEVASVAAPGAINFDKHLSKSDSGACECPFAKAASPNVEKKSWHACYGVVYCDMLPFSHPHLSHTLSKGACGMALHV